jgi:formylglycine-generating enzyme required for sulfatase activity
MEFIGIPAGSFTMGCDLASEVASGVLCDNDEYPAHQVTISQSFCLGKYEVTQAQWEAVMGSNPSLSKGRSKPVEMVSWDDVQVFIERLNAKEGTNGYRLPTEAEWEYAARAGTTSTWSFGDDATSLGRYAWFSDNFGKQLSYVGQRQPNPWGLYDMHGNVDEWVQDGYDKNYYAQSPASDPKGPSGGDLRVRRGGNRGSSVRDLRSANRSRSTPDTRYVDLGFRLALSPGQ